MMIEIKNLVFSFKEKRIFNQLNIRVEKKQITYLLGANGSGKTTLFKLILGLLPSNGEVEILGLQQSRKNKVELMRQVGALIENAALYADLTAYENLKVDQK